MKPRDRVNGMQSLRQMKGHNISGIRIGQWLMLLHLSASLQAGDSIISIPLSRYKILKYSTLQCVTIIMYSYKFSLMLHFVLLYNAAISTLLF